MQKRTSMVGAVSRTAVLVTAAVIFSASGAFAAGYRTYNAPPPMPEVMKRNAPGTGKPYSILSVGSENTARMNGEDVTVRNTTAGDVSIGLRDTGNDLVRVPATGRGTPAGLADARELKLKVRELAAQLIAGMDPSLGSMVALPTSFVSQDDFSQTSPLGRFMAEQLIFEFNQRGFPIREYRLGSAITVKEGQGEFLLTRKVAPVSAKAPNTVFVVGTYFLDRQAVFVNARLVRGNGTVLRTGQVVLGNSPITRRMLAGTGGGGVSGMMLQKGGIPILDFKTATQPTNLTPIDMGADIH